MSLELAAIPLAFVAGMAGVLSPCVWPLVPAVTASASAGGRSGPYFLALGLCASFAVAGTFLTYLLVSLSIDPEFFRYIAAILLVAVGLVLVVPPLTDWFTLSLSRLTARFPMPMREGGSGPEQSLSARCWAWCGCRASALRWARPSRWPPSATRCCSSASSSCSASTRSSSGWPSAWCRTGCTASEGSERATPIRDL